MKMLCGCLAALALLAGCGESAEEKAQASVCDARADIQKQVGELDSLTAATVTLDGVKGNLQAIRDDLKQIKDAQGDLNGDRKAQAEQAWQTFTGEVKTVSDGLLRSISAADGKQQLATAFDSLAQSFRSAFSPVDCSST
jgi:hypothetical protein